MKQIEADIDDGHTIGLVASVSFDRQKRQFKYEGDHEQVFGKEKLAEMQQN